MSQMTQDVILVISVLIGIGLIGVEVLLWRIEHRPDNKASEETNDKKSLEELNKAEKL